MPKRYSSKETISKLKKLGFFEFSQKGSHLKLKHKKGAITIVPVNKKILPPGTVKGIIDLAHIDKKTFENA